MKLTMLLLITAILQVSATTSSAQKVTLSEKQVAIQKVFDQIRLQTHYDFVFADDVLKGIRPVTINVKNVDLKIALDEIFHDQPLDYTIEDNAIVISRKEGSFPDNTKDKAPKILALPVIIKGRVLNEKGQPLPGATIIIKEKKLGYSTTDKGEFVIKLDQGENVTLSVSYVGYITKEFKVGKVPLDLDIILEPNTSSLDQVQIVAYGTSTQRFNVGSVVSVNASDIEKQPVNNPLLALQGRVPGLEVNSESGVPGARVQLQIRGQNSISSNYQNLKPYDQPLFIIDGIPFAPQNNNINQLSNLASSSSAAGGISQPGGLSPFASIDPSDIESISILKDADATSIYGSQGANGVVLITTKKGNPGKTVFNLNVNSGFNSPTRMLKLMNTQQYLQLRKDAFAADGVTPSSSPFDEGYAPDLTIFDQNKNTNWEKVIFGKTSNNTTVHASLSGGDVNNTFMVALGYSRNNYNYPGDGFAAQQMSMHSNLSHFSTDKRFTMSLTTDVSYGQNNSPGFGGLSDVLLPPNTPDLLDAAGNLIWNYKGVSLANQYQFYSYLKQPTTADVLNLNTGLHLSYKLAKGLNIGALVGYSRISNDEHNENPAAAQDPGNIYRTASFATSTIQTVNIEPQIDYTYTQGKSRFSALLGGTYKKNLDDFTNLSGSNYASDAFLGSINGASSVYARDGNTIYRYSAAFARLNYIYDQKYIVNLTARRDGSSNFGPGRQFGNFGSAGLGWIFSEEQGFKKLLPFVSFAKLAANYGTTGTDGIAGYQYQAFWKPNSSVPTIESLRPDVPVNLYNPDYSWALKKSLNVSLDLGFFQDRLLFHTDYYRSREGNQLAGYPLPSQAGFSTVLENIDATVQDKGWEFTLSSINIKKKDFSWNTNFNVSFNRNKLISFPNLAGSSYAGQYAIGQPTSIIYGYQFAGLNPSTGLFQYKTANGGLTTSPRYGLAANGGDMVPIANGEIKFMGGFGNDFRYKQISLSVFFEFSKRTAPNYLSAIYGSNFPGAGTTNLPVEALNYWKNPGDHTTLQKLTATYAEDVSNAGSAFAQSSGAFSDDTYLRLKTVALSYNLPDKLTKKLRLQNASIYVNVQNLLTFTDYKVTDPEQPGDFTAFPLQRIVAFGLNLHF